MPSPDEIKVALQPLATRTPRWEVSLHDVRVEAEECCVVVRFIGYDDGSVRDIREQEVRAPTPLFEDLQRVGAFALGHGEALKRVFEAPAPELATSMPSDLIHLRALELVRARQPEEFTKALLTKKRLGKLLA